MAHQIKDTFLGLVNLETIDDDEAKRIIKYVTSYELRDANPQAFNTYTLGIYKGVFTNDDRDNFIESFVFNDRFTTVSEIKNAIKHISAINTKFIVSSDPFNLFISYLLHCLMSSKNIKQNNVRQQATVATLKLLQYKFFTSLVNHDYPYKPDEAIMRAMFENLSNKYEIKVYGTWSKVMSERAIQLLSTNSIHYRTLMNYDDDKAILYFITDTQTRVRSQVVNVNAAFYAAKEESDRIGTYGSVGTNKDGESGLVDRGNALDSAILNIYNDCMNVTKFLDSRLMRIVTSQFNAIHPTVFKAFLIAFSEFAVKSTKEGSSRKVQPSEDGDILIGPEILVNTIIQQCYRFCMNNRIDINRPLLVIKSIRDVFSSSRVSDENILQIKRSLNTLVLNLQSNRRDIVLSGLRISFVLYILLLSFKYTGVIDS